MNFRFISVLFLIATLFPCGTSKENVEYSSYLFSYFTGNSEGEEAICYAISPDGYNYYALNNNQPILSSDKISNTGGVRDPYILRSFDGKTFYMVATDLLTQKGWSNHAMVLLKSSDLVNWTSTVVNIPETFPEFSEVHRVWAPQTIYDEEKGKYMIYFSMLEPEGYDIIYYAYANDEFTGLESAPKQLFFSPTKNASIDGDIIKKNGKYHLFYKTEGERDKGIKVAISDKLTSGYTALEGNVDQTDQAVEGSSVFKLINSETYILMYDVYMDGRYQFTESNDLENFKVIDQQVLMNFHPRHGMVIPITKFESERLLRTFPSDSLPSILGSDYKEVKNQ